MNDLEYRPFTSTGAKEPSLLNVEQRIKFHTSRNDHLILPEAWEYILHEEIPTSSSFTLEAPLSPLWHRPTTPATLETSHMAFSKQNCLAHQFCATLFSDSIVNMGPGFGPVMFNFGPSESFDPRDWDMTDCKSLCCPTKQKGEVCNEIRVGVLYHLYVEDGRLKQLRARAPICQLCGEIFDKALVKGVWPNGVAVEGWVIWLRALATRENRKALT